MSGSRTLVISPNWIGDAVMAQPLLQLLRRQNPGRPIDVLAPPSVAPVWRAKIFRIFSIVPRQLRKCRTRLTFR